MNATNVIVIGGFGVNQRPLADLIEPLTDYSFIDVNAFPAPFTLETLAQQISAQLAKQSDPYCLIAYSCGGLLALKLAELIPQQIKALILINTTPCFMQQDNWQGIAPSNLQRLRQRLNNSSLHSFMNYFIQLIARPAILNHAELAAWQSSANNKANLEQWLDILASCDLRNLISQLTPALIWLNAKQDQLIPYPQQNQAAQILTSSSHLQLDRQQLNAKIAEFL
jgi:pimeloyl-[acyl-carrier protein] methyl ester esterase